ncbi:MAG: hypothetical protein ACJ741_14025 [Pyrinomonadaceae bacterium]
MNTRRFFLRLAVAVITFLVGWTAAMLFGAARPSVYEVTPYRVVIVRDYTTTTPRFEHAPCGSYEMRHAFAWRVEHGDDFDAPVPPPPPPPPAGLR